MYPSFLDVHKPFRPSQSNLRQNHANLIVHHRPRTMPITILIFRAKHAKIDPIKFMIFPRTIMTPSSCQPFFVINAPRRAGQPNISHKTPTVHVTMLSRAPRIRVTILSIQVSSPRLVFYPSFMSSHAHSSRMDVMFSMWPLMLCNVFFISSAISSDILSSLPIVSFLCFSPTSAV